MPRTRKPEYRYGFALALCFSLLLLPAESPAVSYSRNLGNNELYLEAEDPSYFDAGVYFSLLRNPIPPIDRPGEGPLYRYLFEHAAQPNSLLIEVGTYPLPLAGAAVRKWAPYRYDRAAIDGTNIVRAMTESLDFKEPWSLSVFFGHVVDFPSVEGAVEGHGNIGMLVTYGYYHIIDNVLYPDHWSEVELKLKVDKRGGDLQYATSYRIGTQLHSNDDIKDLFYVGLRRGRTDFSEQGFSFIRNTNFQFRVNCSYVPLQVVAISLEAGKQYPFKVGGRTYVLGISLGATVNFNSACRGPLAGGFRPYGVEPIIRPLAAF